MSTAALPSFLPQLYHLVARHLITFRWVAAAICSCVLFGSAMAFGAPVTTSAAITLFGTSAYSAQPFMPFANPNAPKGGYFSQAVTGTFDSFNPLINKGVAVAGTQLLFDTLTVGSPDEPFARYPLLAEKVTRDLSDPSYIIYHLNPAARFSNQSPVTASDVVFTFNTILKEGAPGIQMYFADIASVKALNPHTVRFDFKSATNYELGLIVGEVAILSQQDWQQRSAKTAFNTVNLKPPIGSGPYIVSVVNPGKMVTYTRRSNYWAQDLAINKGRFNFSSQKYLYYMNDEVAFEGFKTGQYTFREENKAKRWVKNYDFTALKKGAVVKVLEPHHNPVPMQALVFNLRRGIFSDIRVRKALTLAFDFDWMNKSLFNGSYERLHSFFHNSELAATGAPSTAERALLQDYAASLPALQKAALLNPWRSPGSDASGFNRANLLQARALLIQAGYSVKQGLLIAPNGKPVEIEVLLYSDSMQRVILPWITSLKRLGITAKIRMTDRPQYIERLRQFDYEVIVDGFSQSLSPGNEQFGYWGSASATQPGSNNTAGIQNPFIDDLIAQLVATKDRQQQLHITHALDRTLRAGYYMIPMYGLSANRLSYWNLYSKPNRKPQYTVGEDYWWYDPVKAKTTVGFLPTQATTSLTP